jgi:hypothetical protein
MGKKYIPSSAAGMRIASGTLVQSDIDSFFDSVRQGKADSVKYCLDNWEWLVGNTANPTKAPPLVIAAQEGHLPVVKMLCEHSADINAGDAGGMTAIMYAGKHGQRDVARYLISLGADPAATNSSGMSALSMAHGHDFWPLEEEMKDLKRAYDAEITAAREESARRQAEALRNVWNEAAKQMETGLPQPVQAGRPLRLKPPG